MCHFSKLNACDTSLENLSGTTDRHDGGESVGLKTQNTLTITPGLLYSQSTGDLSPSLQGARSLANLETGSEISLFRGMSDGKEVNIMLSAVSMKVLNEEGKVDSAENGKLRNKNDSLMENVQIAIDSTFLIQVI